MDTVLTRARKRPAWRFSSRRRITFRAAEVHVLPHLFLRVNQRVLLFPELLSLEQSKAQQREFLHANSIPSNQHQVRADEKF